MRAALVALIFITTQPAYAELRKDGCHATAETALKDMASAQKVLDRMLAVGFGPLIKKTDGQLKQAAETASSAQSKAIEALTHYVSAMDDLSYQLRLCAR